MPSFSLPAYPFTKHSVVSRASRPFQTLKWMCAAGRPRVGHRLDRAEIVLAGRAGQEAAEALKIGVELGAIFDVILEVGPVAIALPDLDDRIADRVAFGVQSFPLRCVISPTAGVIASLMMSRSLSVSSGSLVG